MTDRRAHADAGKASRASAASLQAGAARPGRVDAGKLERLLRPNPFPGDMGEMSPDMAAAQANPDPGASLKGIVAALAAGRVLVPALPHEHPGRTDDGGVADHESEPDPTADAAAEAATLSVRIPGGRFATPVFSCAERLSACYPGARPIPVLGANAAARALTFSGVLALDPRDRSGKGCIALGRSAVAAVAAGDEWAAPWDNPRVLEGFERALSEGGHSARVSLAPMHSGVIRLYVAIDAASEADAYRAVAAVVAAAEEDKCLRAHLDVVEVVPVSANSHA